MSVASGGANPEGLALMGGKEIIGTRAKQGTRERAATRRTANPLTPIRPFGHGASSRRREHARARGNKPHDRKDVTETIP